MQDKYDFMCIVDDIFKECVTISDLNFRFIEMQNILAKCSLMAIKGQVHISYLDKINKNINCIHQTLEKKYLFLENYLKNKKEISLFNFKEFSALSKHLEKNNAEFLKELESKIKNKAHQKSKENIKATTSGKGKEIPQKDNTQIKENATRDLIL